MRFKSFYPILDTDSAARREMDLVAVSAEILEGGARLLQLRHKGFFSREIFEKAKEIANLCRQANALFVVNDRPDIARLLGAAVHLGQHDLSPTDARTVLGEGPLIGFSTHNEAQLRAAVQQPADYLALGPIFNTASKMNPDPVVGLEELRRIRALTDRPLVAIGGITRSNARSVLAAGADSVAVIGELIPQAGSIRSRVEEWILSTTPSMTSR